MFKTLIDFFVPSIVKETNMQTKVHEGKYGFYPCDYETYERLRVIARYWLLTQKRLRSWHRWNRKLPKNRVIREYFRNEKGQKIGSKVVGPSPEPDVCCLYTNVNSRGHRYMNTTIIDDYWNAKYPKSDKNHVRPLKMSQSEIDNLYNQTVKWFKLE